MPSVDFFMFGFQYQKWDHKQPSCAAVLPWRLIAVEVAAHTAGAYTWSTFNAHWKSNKPSNWGCVTLNGAAIRYDACKGANLKFSHRGRCKCRHYCVDIHFLQMLYSLIFLRLTLWYHLYWHCIMAGNVMSMLGNRSGKKMRRGCGIRCFWCNQSLCQTEEQVLSICLQTGKACVTLQQIYCQTPQLLCCSKTHWELIKILGLLGLINTRLFPRIVFISCLSICDPSFLSSLSCKQVKDAPVRQRFLNGAAYKWASPPSSCLLLLALQMRSMCKRRHIKDINANEEMLTWHLECTGLNALMFKNTADMMRHKKQIFHSQQILRVFDLGKTSLGKTA